MKKTIKNTIPLFTFLNLILLLLIFMLRNIVNMDVLSFLILFFLLFCLFCYKPSIFLKYIFSIFSCVFMLLGLYLCNKNGLYLYEIEKYSHYNGSFSIAIIYFAVYFIFLLYFDSFYEKKFKYLLKNNNNYKIIIFLLFAIEIVCFLSVLKKPSFILNVDRFAYSKYYLNPIIEKLQNIFVYLSPVLVLPFVEKNNTSKKKNIFIIFNILLLFFLYGMWTGNKFGLFFNIFYLIFSPLTLLIGNKCIEKNLLTNLKIQEKNFVKFKFNIIRIICISLILLLLAIVPYYFLRNIDFGDGLLKRTAQQGQLWWATFEMRPNNIKIDEINDELLAIKSLNSNKDNSYGYSYGVYKIMKLVTPNNVYLNVINNDYRYSAQGIEIAYYYFGYFGIIIHSILRALFEALLVNLLIKYLFSKRIIETMITSKLIILIHSVFSQGDLYLIFSKSTFIMILGLILCNMIYKKGNGGKVNENFSNNTC